MNQKAEQQPDVPKTISRSLSVSEENRRQLRFEYNLGALAVGSFRVLGSKEFLDDLAGFFADDGNKNRKMEILTTLGEAAVCPDRTIREKTLNLLSRVAPYSVQEGDHQEIVVLLDNLSRWLEYEPEVLPGFPLFCLRIEQLVAWLLQQSLWQDAEKALALLALIQGGGLGKGAAIRNGIGQSLRRLAAAATIETLIDGFLQNDRLRDLYLANLRSLGESSAGRVFRRIVNCTEQEQRQQLLDLAFIVAGEAFPAHVEEVLRQQPAAETLRDIIQAVADNNEERAYPLLHHYLAHEDKQVQHEMIRYIVKLGGQEMKDRLLAALGVVHNSLRFTVIRLLAENAGGDESVMSALGDFIDRRNTLAPDARQGVVRAIVIALRSYPHRQSMELLDNLYRDYEHVAGSASLLLQIEHSLNMLNPRLRHARHVYHDPGEVVFESDPVYRQQAYNRVAKIEVEMRRILHQGDSKAAGRFLYQQARTAGRERDFVAAEMLRDRIFQVDPMALDEMVELSDWLENQKKAIVEPLQDETWSKLGGLLTPAELRGLQKAMHREQYGKGELIIRAGEADESLYFITSGTVGLHSLSGGDEQFLKRMKPGDILGSAPFFTASLWTFSLRALADVHVHLLRREAFGPLVEEFPEIGTKLHRYCAKYEEMIAELMKTTGSDRREFPRFPAVRPIAGCLQDPFGTGQSNTFHGHLVNISRQGLSFATTIAARENPRLLVGREIVSAIHADGATLARCSGIVVAVSQETGVSGAYGIHVKFARLMDQVTLNRIVSLG